MTDKLMTVEELIEKLKKFDSKMPVLIWKECECFASFSSLEAISYDRWKQLKLGDGGALGDDDFPFVGIQI